MNEVLTGFLLTDIHTLEAVKAERTEARAEAFRAQERVVELKSERDKELSRIADALGVAGYGGAYTYDDLLKAAKARQERVRELENLLAPWGLLVAQRVERLTLGGVDREHEREENRAMDRVRAEAVEIATKRREGK